MTKLRIFTVRVDPGLSRWASVIIRVFERGRQAGRQRGERMLIALKMECGAMSQGQAASRRWKSQGNRSSPRASRKHAARQTHFRFSSPEP